MGLKTKKSIENKGVQTLQNITEFLKFPRSTQTEYDKTIYATAFTQTDTTVLKASMQAVSFETCGLKNKEESLENNIQTIEVSTQTDVGSQAYDVKETCDESTQTLNILDVECGTKNASGVTGIPEMFMSCTKRESSPFASILPSVSVRPTSSSILFPSLISHALRSGAGAGTMILVLGLDRFVVLFISFFIIIFSYVYMITNC